MMKHRMQLLFLFVIACSTYCSAQSDNNIFHGKMLDGDTVAIIYLPEVAIVGQRTWKNQRELNRYTRLQRDVRKVYPYAQRAGIILQELDKELGLIEKGKDRRKYVDELELKLKDQFEGDLRNMTVRQGKILIKLIDRQTERTAYNVVKEMKGGVSAFFWQGIARIFGSSLKYEYDVQEERDIENIIRKIEDGYYAHMSL